jgi:glycosyltransferase involved in cell wall biosynthesis
MGISIITRTKDRPLLLPRVVQSLAAQSSQDFEWIVVNDGGSKDCVDAAISAAVALGITATMVQHDISRGMEAASNSGIKQAQEPYILIHDDDDSLAPEFIERTLGFLQNHPHYLGVVTHSNKIIEKIENGKVIKISSDPLNPGLESVDLSLLAMRNQFPPISFVFSRAAYDLVGGFNEALPVLGDWDFNLRMLLQGDIGLIPQSLANHHHRYEIERGKEVYGNTVTVGVQQHLAWESRYRHEKLREDLASGRVGLGHILCQAKQQEVIFRELERLRVAGDGWNTLMKISRKIGLHHLLKRL